MNKPVPKPVMVMHCTCYGMAYRLEVASRNGETPLCQSETKAFCEKMKLFCDRLLETTLMKVNDSTPKTAIGMEELRQKL